MPNLKLNFLSNVTAGAWVALLQVAFVPVYIRLLGMESYGLIGLYGTIQAWMLVMDLGMTPTLTREFARDLSGGIGGTVRQRKILRTLETVTVSIAVIFWGLLILSSGWLATHWLQVNQLSTFDVALSLSLMGGIVAARWMTGLYRGGLIGLQKQVWMNIFCGLFGSLRIAGVVPFLLGVSQTVTAFFIFQGIIVLLEMLTVRIYLKSNLTLGEGGDVFSWEILGQVKRFAGGMTLLTLLGTLLTQVDKAILSKVLPLSEFGLYAFAGVVACSLQILVLAVTGALSPRLSQLVAEGDEGSLVRVYHQGARLMSTLLLSFGIFLVVFPDVVVTLWTGDRVFSSSVASLLVPLAIAIIINGMMNMPYHLQVAYGWTRLSVWSTGVSVALLGPAIMMTVPRFGSTGAAVCWAGINVGQFFITIPIMHRKILKNEYRTWLIHDVAKQVCVSLSLAVIFRLWVDWAGVAQTKLMWGLLPVFGIVIFGAVSGVSGFWPYAKNLRYWALEKLKS